MRNDMDPLEDLRGGPSSPRSPIETSWHPRASRVPALLQYPNTQAVTLS